MIQYFYPKDSTPGCTNEVIGFTEILSDFQQLKAKIVGISPDSPQSHKDFIEKKNLKVSLLSDPDKIVLKEYGAWGRTKQLGIIQF